MNLVERSERESGGPKPVRLISKMRDTSYRPTILSVVDVLEIVERHRLEPLGDLRGGHGGRWMVGGHEGFLPYVKGETAGVIFRIALPFCVSLKGVDSAGKLWSYDMSGFDTMRIHLDGRLELNSGHTLDKVRFNYPDLPFEWTSVRGAISMLMSRYANDRGFAMARLGRNLPTTWVDYGGLAQVPIRHLKDAQGYIEDRWQDVAQGKAPSRETISLTLQGLSMRQRTRTRREREDIVRHN